MENNIYIGNRYVPVFADPVEWDRNREYESLTMVTYVGTCYTSRKRVPAGTLISNTEYWVVTGNYNQQVEEYRQATQRCQDDIDALSQYAVKLNNRVNLLDNRRFVLIGDSYILGGPTAGGTNYGWGYYFRQKSGLANADCAIYGVGGSGFVGTASTNFLGFLNQSAGEVTNHDTITDVVFAGGYNDRNATANELASAVPAAIARAKEIYPNARVWVAMVGYSTSISEEGAIRNALIDTSYRYYINTVNYGGTYIIDSEMLLPSNPVNLMSADTTHPNEFGYHTMGCGLYDAITTNGVMPTMSVSSSNAQATAVSGSNYTGNTYCSIDKNVKTIYVPDGIHYTPSDPVTIAYDGSLEICKYGRLLYGSNPSFTYKPIRIFAQHSGDTKFYAYNVDAYIRNGSLWFKFRDMPESGVTGWQGIENMTQFYTQRFTLEYDSRLV